MNVLIVDDEAVARRVLREHADSIPSLEVIGEASTGPEALEQILQLKPDLVFLDLEMPEMTGLNVVRNLRGRTAPLIIFVTAYQQHALDAFEVGAVDYLLKPVRRERLSAAVDKARRQFEGQKARPAAPGKIVGRKGADLYLLDSAEIVAFEADGELVHVITIDQRYLCEHSLKAMEEKLAGTAFRRIHRRTLINTDHIRKISRLSSKRWLLRMSNGLEAVVSKRQAGLIREHSLSFRQGGRNNP